MKLYVCAENKRFNSDAEALAKRLEAPLIEKMEDVTKEDLVLYMGKDGLSLRGNGLVLREDFTEMLSRVKDDMWMHELLAKSAKLKNDDEPLTAIDATAGLGEDSLILAAAGYNVVLYEYDPVIAALLKDALRRAKKIPELAEMVGRMQLINGNSIEAMSKMVDSVDLVYLDPMFPGRQKSALIKKKFQLLQKLECPCMEEKELLEAAMSVKPQRIVIKRPAKGPFVADVKPDFSFKGKAVRYDCFSFR